MTRKKVNPKKLLINSLEETKLLIASPWVEIIKFDITQGITNTSIYIEIKTKDFESDE
jgi:hypothetical protein